MIEKDTDEENNSFNNNNNSIKELDDIDNEIN